MRRIYEIEYRVRVRVEADSPQDLPITFETLYTSKQSGVNLLSVEHSRVGFVPVGDAPLPFPTSTLPQVITADEVSEMMKIPKMAVYELARTSRLPVIRIGRRVRFDKSKIQSFLESGGA